MWNFWEELNIFSPASGYLKNQGHFCISCGVWTPSTSTAACTAHVTRVTAHAGIVR